MHNEACVSGCAVEVMCGTEWSTERQCVTWCEDNLVEAAKFTTFCHDAWENLHQCIGTLDCDGYADYLMGGESCYEAYFLQQFECEGQ